LCLGARTLLKLRERRGWFEKVVATRRKVAKKRRRARRKNW